MIFIELIGVFGLGYVLYKGVTAWDWKEILLAVDEEERIYMAGPDDEDIDFDAALHSLDRAPLPPLREYREWEGIPR